MPSVREQILAAFFEELKTLETESIKVFRNLDKSQKVPDGGALIVLRDGQSNDPEVLLSPLTYIYEQQSTVEVIINTAFAEQQETSLDELLMIIGNLVEYDRTMGGLAEWAEPSAPDFQQEAIEGAPAIRMATVTILFRFATASPLS